MENNVGRVVEGIDLTTSPGQRPSPTQSFSAEEEPESNPSSDFNLPSENIIEKKLQYQLRPIRDRIDSPRTLLILKNAVLTLLELEVKQGDSNSPEKIDGNSLLSLLSNDDFRKVTLAKLASSTPSFWDDNWDRAFAKDAEPLYSERQQRIMRRRSLIVFWTKEWDSIPKEKIEKAIEIATSL